MQPKSESFSEFSERTELLGAKLGLKLGDLPDRIGISTAMFCAYRTGKNRISEKAWRKLESAEAAAGIKPPVTAPLGGAATPGTVEELCMRIREEFYSPVDSDFAGRSAVESAAILQAMGAAIVDMERRRDAYIARAVSEGSLKQKTPATAAERAEAEAIMDDIERQVDADDLPEIKPPVVRRRA